MAVTDISPEILEDIESHFDTFYKDPKVKEIYKKIADGNATYADAQKLAELVGKYITLSLDAAYSGALEKGKLPNDTLYQNIVEKTLKPMLEEGYDVMAEACDYIQTDLNKKAGKSIKTVYPGINKDKAKGLVYEVVNTGTTQIRKTKASGQIENFTRCVVDDFVRTNIDFHELLGLKPEITRMRGSNPNKKCSFCHEREYKGKYKGPGMPSGIFQRHRYCHCMVLYDPKDGSGVQGAHSKQVYANHKEAISQERRYLKNLDKMDPQERRFARNARARERRRSQYTPEEWAKRKKIEAEIAGRAATQKALSVEERKKIKGVDTSRDDAIIKQRKSKLLTNGIEKESDLHKQKTPAIKKSISKIEKRIEEHRQKVAVPEEYFPDWKNFDERYRQGLKKHWKKEINNYEESIKRRKRELLKRGEKI